MYNKLSNVYDALYLNNLLEFQKNIKEYRKHKNYYVDMYPSLGIKPGEICDFLVYGQATNGWSSDFFVDQAFESIHVERSSNESNRCLESEGHNPLDWVNVFWSKNTKNSYFEQSQEIRNYYGDKTYYAYRSFFWQVVTKLVGDECVRDRKSTKWSEHLVWSNLYKIAPENANPNDNEIDSQILGSVELLKQEIKELRPKNVIILTNDYWWRPFRERIKTKVLHSFNELNEIHSVEDYQNTRIIVTKRPFTGDSDLYVAKIKEYLKT